MSLPDEQPDRFPRPHPDGHPPESTPPSAPAEPVSAEPADPVPVDPVPGERPPTPAVDAERLGLHGRDRWAYQDVDLYLPQGTLLAVAGPKGSGRSTLLLTLTGRMRPTDGRLSVFGHPVPERAAAVRRLSAVARIARAVALEPELTVAETVRERALLDVVPAAAAQDRFADGCTLLGLDLHRHALVEDLAGVEQTLLAVAVALVGAPRFLVLDDVDAGLHSHEEARVWQGLRALADTGVTVAGTTNDPGPAEGYVDAVLRLQPGPATVATKGRFR